jgi:hypothetical protein
MKSESEDVMLNKCELEKSKEFEDVLKNNHVDINSFVRLFNIWIDMTIDERGECLDKLAE